MAIIIDNDAIRFLTEFKVLCDKYVSNASIAKAEFKDEDELNVLVEYVLKRQKPAEWSEDDERRMSKIMHFLESQNYFNAAPEVNRFIEPFKEEIDWLKSLRPQKQWKPSDEQIEILDMVLTNESMDDNIARILRELREQLKKLRDE